ncbi:hypothetical protein JCM6882_008803 [Rhodosporidiobolus microsporus]
MFFYPLLAPLLVFASPSRISAVLFNRKIWVDACSSPSGGGLSQLVSIIVCTWGLGAHLGLLPQQRPAIVRFCLRLYGATWFWPVQAVMLFLCTLFFWPSWKSPVETRISNVCSSLPNFAVTTCVGSGTAVHYALLLGNLPLVAISFGAVFVLAALAAFEPVWWASFALLLARAWSIIYGQLIEVFCPSLWSVSEKEPIEAFRERCTTAFRTAKRYSALQRALDAKLAEPSFAHVSQSLTFLDSPWCKLLGSDDVHLSATARYFSWMSKTATVTWKDLDRKLLKAALKPVLKLIDEELSQRTPSQRILPLSFSHSAHELAGIFIKFLLPLPSLAHLARPFRLRAFLPFFMPFPLLQRLPISRGAVNLQTISEELAGPGEDFTLALTDYLTALRAAGVEPKDTTELVALLLSTAKARREAVAAEEKAHETVLDAVLLWKEAQRDRVSFLGSKE